MLRMRNKTDLGIYLENLIAITAYECTILISLILRKQKNSRIMFTERIVYAKHYAKLSNLN